MGNFPYEMWVAIVAIFTAVYFISDLIFLKLIRFEPMQVPYENAKQAIGQISSWTAWLTALQTGAMAAMGALATREGVGVIPHVNGFFALLFFGFSIILSTWLLSALPSIQQRLITNESSTDNDIYMMKIFSFIPIRLGRFSGLIHLYFLIGVIFFALFVFKLFNP